MRRRQTMARQWLIIAGRPDRATIKRATRLPLGSGVLLLEPANGTRMLQLRVVARSRNLVLVNDPERTAARVHDLRELRSAMLGRKQLVLLSPLHPTPTHPDWQPIARMRAAALARLGRRGLLALGGMDDSRYRLLAPLGFVGWAGMSAWSRRSAPPKRRK